MPWRLKPALGNILVEPLKDEEITASGLFIVHQVEKETHIALVVDVCDPYEATADDRSVQRAGPTYHVDQLVIIGKYNGRQIKIRQEAGKVHEEYIIIRESDVLGTLEEKVQPLPVC